MYSLSSISLSLTVYSILDYRPLNTTLIINIGDSSVIVNQTFTITCDTQANPPATYEIFRDDGNNVGSNSVLTTFVSEVEENNRVTFTCKASNAYGDGRQKLPWKCIVSVTVSSRYVRCVASLFYKYACSLYWYYKRLCCI